VVALESNRLDTPVIGLVTADVWHEGRLGGAGRSGGPRSGGAGSDPRAAGGRKANGEIVWRTPDCGTTAPRSTVQGLALGSRVGRRHRGLWASGTAPPDCAGRVVKTDDDRELKLFAATFLASATAALQEATTDGRVCSAMSSVPTATARNAVLAGTGAVLREQAQAIRESIARDGFYLRVPAGKSFYLYRHPNPRPEPGPAQPARWRTRAALPRP
jgi:hypothetical protein